MVDQLNEMGADLAENVVPGDGGAVYVDAVVSPQEKAEYQALGAEPVATLQDEATAQANKADRDAALAEQADSLANLKAGKGVRKARGAGLAADTVQAQRADYFENYAGRFLSIEGWTSAGTNSGTRYSGPALTASWLDASGNTVGTGTLSAFVDDSVYQYHTNLFRVGNVGDGGTMPATVRVASANGGVDTIAVKQWVSQSGSGQYPNGFLKDFNTHYVDPQEAMAKIRALQAEFPNISKLIDLPNKTPGYQRLSQAIVGTTTPYNPQITSLSSAGTVASADQPKAVVVTSKLMGQSGGNTESITITNPNGAAGQALSVSLSGKDITVNPATDATGAITSTAAQVIAIFIVPVINMDGAAYSMYDFNQQRKNMVDYCPQANSDPTSRNGWGVDLNRNFSVGSLFDGYDGGSSSCTSETFSGPFELSEPEVRNETWIQSTYTNIKFAMNIHSYGGYFMWPPGAYKAAGRVTLPYPSPGTLQYFQQTANSVLDRIKSYRGTAILPSRTGPVADVLYSAAGNSADEAYYSHNIIGYDFEVGADRFTSTTTGTSQSAVNFQPNYATEGHEEGMEFANGNYALLESALDYQNDHNAPVITPVGPDVSATPFDVTLNGSEAADIHYTTDGSTPTDSSPAYAPSRPRGLPAPIHIGGTTTLRWTAKDFAGNVSTGSKTFYIGMQSNGDVGGTTAATLSLVLGTPAVFGAFTPGVGADYSASTTATVISTAGDGTLSVADPSATATGHLVNGAFSLPQALQVKGSSAAGAATAYAPVGGSASPTTVLTYAGPTSNDVVNLGFKQTIGATDALRTGTYAKTLTFTLSTTNP